jgi:hypothetical protein
MSRLGGGVCFLAFPSSGACLYRRRPLGAETPCRTPLRHVLFAPCLGAGAQVFPDPLTANAERLCRG